MKPLISESQERYKVEVSWSDRWLVYQRLQELDIPCWCEANQPLTVDISHPMSAIQLWCVVRQVLASRRDLIQVLKKCWHNCA